MLPELSSRFRDAKGLETAGAQNRQVPHINGFAGFLRQTARVGVASATRAHVRCKMRA
jgi:hypothetical protein